MLFDAVWNVLFATDYCWKALVSMGFIDFTWWRPAAAVADQPWAGPPPVAFINVLFYLLLVHIGKKMGHFVEEISKQISGGYGPGVVKGSDVSKWFSHKFAQGRGPGGVAKDGLMALGGGAMAAGMAFKDHIAKRKGVGGGGTADTMSTGGAGAGTGTGSPQGNSTKTYDAAKENAARDSLIAGENKARDNLIEGENAARNNLTEGEMLARQNLISGENAARDALYGANPVPTSSGTPAPQESNPLVEEYKRIVEANDGAGDARKAVSMVVTMAEQQVASSKSQYKNEDDYYKDRKLIREAMLGGDPSRAIGIMQDVIDNAMSQYRPGDYVSDRLKLEKKIVDLAASYNKK